MEVSQEWKLYWVEEDSEVYAARSAEEAIAFVEDSTGAKVDLDAWGEVNPSPLMTGVNGDTGETINMLTEWERTKAEGITEPFQFWTSYL